MEILNNLLENVILMFFIKFIAFSYIFCFVLFLGMLIIYRKQNGWKAFLRKNCEDINNLTDEERKNLILTYNNTISNTNVGKKTFFKAKELDFVKKKKVKRVSFG